MLRKMQWLGLEMATANQAVALGVLNVTTELAVHPWSPCPH